MREELSALLDNELAALKLFVSDVKKVNQEGVITLEIELDSPEIIDLDMITEATNIINPILDASGIIDDQIEVVDIYGKSKEVEE